MKTVYRYADFREYLKDYYLEKKSSEGGFSYARFSKLLGFSSPNYAQLIVDGDRNLTVSNIHQIARALGLDFEETSYFEALVHSCQATAPEEAQYYRKRLKLARTGRPDRGAKLRPNVDMSKWYYPAVLVYLGGKDATVTPALVASAVGVSASEAQSCMSDLLKRGLIEEREGKFHQTYNHVTWHDHKSTNVFQKQYLGAQLERSRHAFERAYDRGAKFHAHTFAVGAGNRGYYLSRLHAFVESMIAEADREPSDELVQLNFQYFGLGDLQ